MLVLTVAASTYLVSPFATSQVDPFLHRLTGIWNLADLIGHMVAIATACIAVYMGLIRFGDFAIVQKIYHQRVVAPLTVIVPVLVALFFWGDGHATHAPHFENMPTTPLLSAYWIAYWVALTYLWGFAAWLFLELRSRTASHTVLNLYLLSYICGQICFTAAAIQAVTNVNADWLLLVSGSLSALGFTITPAYSWLRRSRPLQLPDIFIFGRVDGESPSPK